MITYKEIRKLVRYKLKDNDEIRFSDYEIKMALNECLRYFGNNYALQNSDFLEKFATFDMGEMNAEIEKQNAELEEGEEPTELYDFQKKGVELPEDFLMLKNITNQWDEPMFPCEGYRTPDHHTFKVVGDRLYTGASTFNMHYRCSLVDVKKEDDEIALPTMFKDAIVQLVCMVLNNNAEGDVLMAAVDDAVANLVPRRRYANVRFKMPFMIGGRR